MTYCMSKLKLEQQNNAIAVFIIHLDISNAHVDDVLRHLRLVCCHVETRRSNVPLVDDHRPTRVVRLVQRYAARRRPSQVRLERLGRERVQRRTAQKTTTHCNMLLSTSLAMTFF